MSLLRRMKPYSQSYILRRLLEKLDASGELKVLIESSLESILSEANILLTEKDRQQLQEQPVDYLLGTASPLPPSPPPPNLEAGLTADVKKWITVRFLAELDPDDNLQTARWRAEELLTQLLADAHLELSRRERQQLFDEISAELFGFGPLEPLLSDENITAIRVLGAKQVLVTRSGRLEQAPVTFENEEHILRILDRMFAPQGVLIDDSTPIASVRLPNGTWVTAIIRPPALSGPILLIRKSVYRRLTADDLVQSGMLTTEVLQFLQAAVQAGLNIVISGEAVSGKTTLLNVLCAYIPDHEFIVMVGDSIELQLHQERVAVLQSRPPNIEGKGEISVQQLTRAALRMSPDRLVIEEVRRGEAADLLQAPVSWMTTLRSPSPHHVVVHLENLCLMSDATLPTSVLRTWLSNVVDLIVHLDWKRDGSRCVTSISEVGRGDDSTITVSALFTVEDRRNLPHSLRRTGTRPSAHLLERLTTSPVDEPLRQQIQGLFA